MSITKNALAMHLGQPCLIVIFANLHFSYFLSDLVNALDPLNGEAVSFMRRDCAAYEQRVKGSNPC